jgi:hypothetical protein
MSILAQHGHAKSNKIEEALRNGTIGGIIYGPRNEKPDSLIRCIENIAVEFPQALRLIDPQFYACTVAGGRTGKLDEYEYFNSDLSYRDLRTGNDIQRYVHAAIDFQLRTSVTHICAPTLAIDSLNDRWSALAVSFAEESIAHYRRVNDRRRLLVSFVIHEQALRDEGQVDEFLDLLTELSCDSFYLVLNHEASSYTQDENSDTLAGFLYLIYVLTQLNGCSVYVGYSDFISIVLHAVGAGATGSGWNQGERRFSMAKFEPKTGGRRAVPRYSSRPLLNSISITPEMDAIYELRYIRRILSGTRYDAQFRDHLPSTVDWPDRISALHHWETLHDLVEPMEGEATVTARIDRAVAQIERAQTIYGQLRDVPFSPQSGPNHLVSWLNGIESFRSRAGI